MTSIYEIPIDELGDEMNMMKWIQKWTVLFRRQFDFKKIIKQNIVPVAIFLIAWQIFEDIILPAILFCMSYYIHSVFLVPIPILWVAQLGPFVLPIFLYFYTTKWKK